MSLGIGRFTLEMPYVHNGNSDSLPIDYYVPKEGFGDEKPTLVMPGLGEEGFTAALLARQLRKDGHAALIGVLRFSGKDTIDYVCKGAPGFLAKHINRVHGSDEDAPVPTVSHSQGGGAVLIAAPDTVQFGGARHAVIAPVTVNTPYLGARPQDRPPVFWKRLLVENPQEIGLAGLGNWRLGVDLSLRLASDTIGSRIRNGHSLLPYKIGYALQDTSHHAALAGVEILGAESAGTAILTGMNDPVFPRGEMDATLVEHDLSGAVQSIEVPGAHESMITRLGRLQVAAAFEWLEQAA